MGQRLLDRSRSGFGARDYGSRGGADQSRHLKPGSAQTGQRSGSTWRPEIAAEDVGTQLSKSLGNTAYRNRFAIQPDMHWATSRALDELGGEPGNRYPTDIVALRDATLRLAGLDPLARFVLLMGGEFRLAAEFDAFLPWRRPGRQGSAS